jgi:peptidoglycan/LPS O-acetylase OafA/YrhL
MKYRAEIDGLRALAVVPVILFHAGFELFSGGFVGVDVFFVISGYLITTILIEDIENQRFSLVNFYERRARRILPALYFVLLISSVVSTILMSPQQLKDFGQSLIATVTFSSNIYFFLKADYWAQSSEFLPLLHTWSLAVEEQYYLVFPVFLTLAWLFGKNKIFWIIVVIAVISLTLSEWGWRYSTIANFYLSPTRAWELLAGSMAAFIVQKKGVQKNNALAFLGLAAIVFSIFFYEETTPFPSVYALVPVIGVVLLVLYADKETVAAKFLSTKGFVGIGLVSYSAYLWHQPLLAFVRVYQSSIEIELVTKFYIVGITFLLAVLSFYYIERPFRAKGNVSARGILTFAILPLVVFIAYGAYLHNTYGLRELKLSLLSPKTVQYLTAVEQESKLRKMLWTRLLSEAELPFDNTDKPNVLFIGDSLSEDLYVVSRMSQKLEPLITSRRLAFDDECAKHIVTGGRETNHNGSFCADSLKSYLKLDLFNDADVIIVAASWLSNAQYLENLLNHQLLSGKQIVVYQTHAFTDISSLLVSLDSKSDKLGYASKFIFTSKRSRTEFANSIIADIALSHKISTLNGFDAFCDSIKQQCALFDDKGNPLIIDQSHLSKSGIIFFDKWFSKKIVNLLNLNRNE